MKSQRDLIVDLLTLALLLGAPTSAVAAVAEQRCTELGSTCVCSEPLDFSASNIANGYDPPDSEGSGAKECNGGKAIQNVAVQSTVPAANVGLLGPDRVLAVRLRDNLSLVDLNRSFTNSTWCTRNYFRYSADVPVPPPDDMKGPRMEKPQGAPHPGVESEWDNFDGTFHVATGYWGSTFGDPPGPTLASTGGRVTIDQCKASWCRLEFCFDHNDTGGNRLRWRARLIDLSTGETENWDTLSPLSAGTAITGDSTHLIKTYTDFAEDDGKYEWFSHVMVAIKSPADPTFWIGPAREVTSDPENAATTPPASPILLP